MATKLDTRSLTLATRIKVARVGADMTQAQLAAQLGVGRTTLTNWERGGSEPQLSDAVRLAAATGVTLEWLAEGVDTEKAPTANGGSQTVRPKGFEPLTFWSVVSPVPDFIPAEWIAEVVA